VSNSGIGVIKLVGSLGNTISGDYSFRKDYIHLYGNLPITFDFSIDNNIGQLVLREKITQNKR